MIKKLVAYLTNLTGGGGTDILYLRHFDRIVEQYRSHGKRSPIIDIGCGYSYPIAHMLSNADVDVVGVDVSPVFYSDGLGQLWRDGVKKYGYIRATIETPFIRLREKRRLRRLSQRHPPAKTVLKSYDGFMLPYPDSYFRGITSLNVLEHVMDMNRFWHELRRVSAHDAWVDIVYHNYYSPTGAHSFVDASNPWGHVFCGPVNKHSSLNLVHLTQLMNIAMDKGLKIDSVLAMDFDGNMQGDPNYRLEEYGNASDLDRVLKEIESKSPGVLDGLPVGISKKDYPRITRFYIKGVFV